MNSKHHCSINQLHEVSSFLVWLCSVESSQMLWSMSTDLTSMTFVCLLEMITTNYYYQVIAIELSIHRLVCLHICTSRASHK